MFLPSSFNSFTGFVLVEWVATDCMNIITMYIQNSICLVISNRSVCLQVCLVFAVSYSTPVSYALLTTQ